jgi:GDP-D-mannose dehydratase
MNPNSALITGQAAPTLPVLLEKRYVVRGVKRRASPFNSYRLPAA